MSTMMHFWIHHCWCFLYVMKHSQIRDCCGKLYTRSMNYIHLISLVNIFAMFNVLAIICQPTPLFLNRVNWSIKIGGQHGPRSHQAPTASHIILCMLFAWTSLATFLAFLYIPLSFPLVQFSTCHILGSISLVTESVKFYHYPRTSREWTKHFIKYFMY